MVLAHMYYFCVYLKLYYPHSFCGCSFLGSSSSVQHIVLPSWLKRAAQAKLCSLASRFICESFSDVMQAVNQCKHFNSNATLTSNTLLAADGVNSKWKWLTAAVFLALSLYVNGSARMWTRVHVIMTVRCGDWGKSFFCSCTLETPWEWQLWKWRQEEARPSRNAHTQMAFDWLLFDEPHQIRCDTLSLLFRKYTAMHVQNSDAAGKFWLADDTRCVWKIHPSSGVTSAPV